MPVTIYLPPPGGQIGPGFYVQAVTDFIGPIPSDATWTIRASTDPEFATNVFVEHWSIPFYFLQVQMGLPGQEPAPIPDQVVADGTTVHVEAILNSSSGVIDSGTTTATWRPTTMLWEPVRTIVSGGTSGGLTTEQAQLLADDHAAVNPPLIATDGTPITGAVGDVITRPALRLLGIDTTTHVLTGQGTLTVPRLLGVQTAWGLVLDVDDPGIAVGYKPGYVDSFVPRIGQFLLLWPAHNSSEAMVIDEYRLHLEHFTWVWDWANVVAVAYYIAPGATVNARWVSAFFP